MAFTDIGIPHRPSQANVYLRVIQALMLRNMRTRFGGSHWGYGVVVLWPVAHIFMIVAIMVFRGLPSPVGDNTMLFIATGAVPVLMFQYISQEMMKGVMVNKPLTYYPQVKNFDVIMACLIVEIVKGFSGLVLVFGILLAFGVDPMPQAPIVAICGYCASILLGVGIGIVNVGIIAFFPGWIFGFILVRILIYISSGVFFLPNYLPEQIYSVMKWNPAVQIIEWVRLGYYPDLAIQVDYAYVLLWCGFTILIGLLMERYVLRQRV